MPRGGRRTGTPGQAYPNRSDLNANHALPAQAATGQPYGQAGQQLAAQKALPMASAPPLTVPSTPAPSGPAPVVPGSLTPLTAPTQRPNEPLTAGIDSGPGPGSGALGLASPQNLVQLVGQVAKGPNATSDVAALAAFLAQGRL